MRQVVVDVTNSFEKDEHLLRALQLQAEGEFDDAILELRERARLHQRDAYATRTLISLLKRLKRWSPLIEITTTAISQLPNSSKFYMTRAEAYRELQVFGLALHDAQKTLELNPKSEDAMALVEQLETLMKQPPTAAPAK